MRKFLMLLSLLVVPSTGVVWAYTPSPVQEARAAEQHARYKRADAATKKAASKLKQLSLAVLEYADDNKRLDLTQTDFTEKLKPYANQDTFYADAEQKQKFSFNAITSGVDWEKFRLQEAGHSTVVFYEGKDKQLSFVHNGYALVNVASGEVLWVSKEEAKTLLWDVPSEFKK